MLTFFETYGADILAGIVALASLAGSIYALVTTFKTGKKVDVNNQSLLGDIQVTKEGIVEAFKAAKIPSEWKISISNQVNTILTAFSDKVLSLLKEHEGLRTDMMVMILQILSFTAASDKLSDEDKQKILDLINCVEEIDRTIDITVNK